jgi:hypothetical protein
MCRKLLIIYFRAREIHAKIKGKNIQRDYNRFKQMMGMKENGIFVIL